MLRKICIIGLLFLFPILSNSSSFAGQLPLGSVSNVTQISSCPEGFFPGMTCFTATVDGCQHADSLGLIYGVITPSGTSLGTIVLLGGGNGRGPFDENYPAAYFQAGYQIVQVSWDSAWEFAGASQPELSIKAGACRPATFFRYVFDTIHGGSTGQGAMCLQGHSAGSAAVAYSVTEYSAGTYVDKALLTSGPVFGNVLAGCKVPNFPPVTICPPRQLGCNGASWTVPPQYKVGQITPWTGDNTCNNAKKTAREANTDWQDMSVVDGESDSVFSYPQTALSAWLCDNGLNASAPEGEYYYLKFTSLTQFANNGRVPFYSVNRVSQCTTAEDIWNGVVVIQGIPESGFMASSNDMLDPIVGCVKRH